MSGHPKRGAAPRSGAPRLDATNLAGLTSLMNPQHVRAGVNLEDAEKTVMGKSTRTSTRDVDPVRLYTSELNRLAEDLGIDLLDGAPPLTKSKGKITDLIDDIDLSPRRRRSASSASSASEEEESGSGEEESGSGEEESGSTESGSTESGSSESGSSESGSSESGSSESSGSSRGHKKKKGVNRIIDDLEDDLGIRTDGARERHRKQLHTSGLESSERGERSERSRKGGARDHISSVVADIRGETRTTEGVERERVQDSKASKIEQIGQLRMTLEEEGIDCSSVTMPTSETSLEKIDSVLNILRLKNDRNRYSSLAEEVILGLAEGVETVFDGTRTVPLVGWRPDYTGYHNTVNIKLHRMRFETSQVVGGIIEKYKVGATSRIIMELLPSFFLYPRQQKNQRAAPGLASDPRVSDARSAFSVIRASDERRSLDEVRNL